MQPIGEVQDLFGKSNVILLDAIFHSSQYEFTKSNFVLENTMLFRKAQYEFVWVNVISRDRTWVCAAHNHSIVCTLETLLKNGVNEPILRNYFLMAKTTIILIKKQNSCGVFYQNFTTLIDKQFFRLYT